jgi:hypothetical protein
MHPLDRPATPTMITLHLVYRMRGERLRSAQRPYCGGGVADGWACARSIYYVYVDWRAFSLTSRVANSGLRALPTNINTSTPTIVGNARMDAVRPFTDAIFA